MMRKNFVSRETFFRILSILLVSCVMIGSFVSCGKVSYTDEELIAAAEELVKLSYELNDIYFGEGLPIADNREDVERFYSMFESDVSAVNYHPVSQECKYQSEEDIKKATEAVFSPNYCSYLYELAFKGISTVFNEGTENQMVATASFARYVETNGVLTVRIDLPYCAMELGRLYDFDKIEILQKKKKYAIVSVPTEKDGVSMGVQLKLVLTDNGFRLDTPTY